MRRGDSPSGIIGRRHVAISFALVAATALFPAQAAAQQINTGHKIMGALGLDAGVQPPAGVYVGDRGLYYSSNTLVDRNGRPLAVGLDLEALANGAGPMAVVQLPWAGTYLNVSVSLPLARVTGTLRQPEASLDKFGLGDIYVQPVRLGWRLRHFDLGAGYAFYAPTGRFEPGGSGGVGRGQWTQEISVPAAVYFDARRTWQVSALMSCEINSPKIGLHITRGSTVQIQGGAGGRLLSFLRAGVVGYAEWQVTDDTGSALPPVLAGARDRAFGVGAEMDFVIRPLRTALVVRYTHDVAVQARPLGQLLLIGFTVIVWNPVATPPSR
jgi:hypothetical protein